MVLYFNFLICSRGEEINKDDLLLLIIYMLKQDLDRAQERYDKVVDLLAD